MEKGQQLETIESLRCSKCGIENQVYDARSKTYLDVNAESVQDLLGVIPTGDKTVIMGGHYYIDNFENPNNPSRNAQKTFNTACALVSELKGQGLEAYLNVMLNDVELPVRNEDMGLARELVRDNFRFPEIYKEILQQHDLSEGDMYNPTLVTIRGNGSKFLGNTIAKTFNQGAESEKKYVNRFNSSANTSFSKMFPNFSKRIFNMNTGNGNGVPEACAKAITQYLFDLSNTEVDNSIIIAPGCSKGNLEKSIDAMKLAFPRMQSSVIYQTPSCYDQLNDGGVKR